jgi:HNH endonuclease
MYKEGIDIVGGKPISYIQDYDTGGCKIPQGLYVEKSGYVQIYIRGKHDRIHRVVMEDKFGHIPKDQHVCHGCHNRSCFNLEHLEIGTPLHNSYQKIESGRQRYGEDVPNAKLTEKKVTEILISNKSTRELAALYNVCRATINSIKNGVNWPETYKKVFGHYSEKRIAIRKQKQMLDYSNSNIN